MRNTASPGSPGSPGSPACPGSLPEPLESPEAVWAASLAGLARLADAVAVADPEGCPDSILETLAMLQADFLCRAFPLQPEEALAGFSQAYAVAVGRIRQTVASRPPGSRAVH